MSVIVRNTGGSFTPAPPGQHTSVCCDVADLGTVQTKFGDKEQVRIYWQIDKMMDDGRPFLVTRTYTASLHEKATLRRDLEAWRGRPFTEKELDGFDLEKLMGVGALLQVSHKPRNDGQGVYAQLTSIMALPKGMEPPAIDGEYVRWKDRQDDRERVTPPPEDDDVPPPADDECPF